MALKIDLFNNCFCKEMAVTLSADDNLFCRNCGKLSHRECYDPHQGTLSPDCKFLCFDCGIDLIDPFVRLDRLLVPPQLIEQDNRLDRELLFELSSKDKEMIRSKEYQVLLGIQKLEPFVGDTFRIEWPAPDIHITVNGCAPLTYQLDFFIQVPENQVYRGKNSIKLSHAKIESRSMVFVFMSKPMSYVDVSKEILSSLPTIPREETRARVCMRYHQNDRIALLLSLLCPLTGQLVAVPCRGCDCSHLECFDLMGFMKQNENITMSYALRWICPICNKHVLWDQLRIDGFFHNIIAVLPEFAC